ncbi:MAG: AMP-binding protein, partial [Gammaproteobacteria bacterium]|nr:AMP-binding protein [Gammaproteobacteria bacterium]
MTTESTQGWDFSNPDFLNIGVACTSRYKGTDKDNTVAMIIEDTEIGTDEITYKDLDTKTDQFANFLHSIGLDTRDRALIFLKNSLAYPISFLGCIKAGMIAVPTSTLLSGSEVKYLAMDSQAKLLLVNAASYKQMLPFVEQLDNLVHIVVAGTDCVKDLEQPENATVYCLNEILKTADTTPNHYKSKPGEPAYLVYTSGTTGFPKGVLHSHRSLIGREPASEYWFSFKENERIMHSGKFNWTYVLGSALMDPLYRGHTVIAFEGKNDPNLWIELIKRHQCTIFIGVPTIYRQIIQKTEASIADCPSLRHCMSAGEHLSSEMVTAWQERFGQNIYEAIGMSECSYYISHSLHNPIRPGSAGFVQPGHKVKILNIETLEEVGAEEEGMICIDENDPGLFLEYWQLEEQTREAKHNGYFFTGDYAKRDKDGYIWFLGRKDDIINTFGYRVSPHEIERVMKVHDLVDDCVAFGLDVGAGKTIVAIAILSSSEISAEVEDELLTYGQNNLARYKSPKQLYVVKEYPKTKNGKVLRGQLVKEIHEQESSKNKDMHEPDIYRARRSMLYVSAYNIRHLEKSRSVLTDAIIFDMAKILQNHKEPARETLTAEFAKNPSFGYSEKVLRVNILGSEDLEKDLELAKTLDIDALLFPEIETVEQVQQAQAIVESFAKPLEFMINIETPLGVLNVQQICAASEMLKCIVVGSNKLANRMNMNIQKTNAPILGYLSQIALAARAYNKFVIDGPHYNISDEFSCEASTKQANLLGFDGKALIHPQQIEYINDTFTPKKLEVEKSIRLLEFWEKEHAMSTEVFSFEGELFDK